MPVVASALQCIPSSWLYSLFGPPWICENTYTELNTYKCFPIVRWLEESNRILALIEFISKKMKRFFLVSVLLQPFRKWKKIVPEWFVAVLKIWKKLLTRKKNGDKVKKLHPWEDKKSLILQKPIWIKIYSGAIFFLCRKVKKLFWAIFATKVSKQKISRFWIFWVILKPNLKNFC